jgi:hypothetical protein
MGFFLFIFVSPNRVIVTLEKDIKAFKIAKQRRNNAAFMQLIAA